MLVTRHKRAVMLATLLSVVAIILIRVQTPVSVAALGG